MNDTKAINKPLNDFGEMIIQLLNEDRITQDEARTALKLVYKIVQTELRMIKKLIL